MLKAFQRVLGSDTVAATVALATHEALQAELAELKTSAEAAIAELTADKELTLAALAAAQGELDSARAELETLKQFAEAAEAAAAQAAAEAAAAKLNARKEKIVAAVGTERADALMAATQALDDAAFDAIVSAMSLSVQIEAKTGMFAEVGATADANAAAPIEESPEMKILKAKYAQKN
jgi:hypothetical protein